MLSAVRTMLSLVLMVVCMSCIQAKDDSYGHGGSARPDICGIRHDNKCYRLALYESKNVTYEEGKEICSKFESKPANIYSRQHYTEVQKYIRSKVTEAFSEQVTVWLGMTYDRETDEAYLSDGTVAPFKKWHPLHGALGPPGTQLALNTRRKKRDPLQGMSAPGGASFEAHGILCEV